MFIAFGHRLGSKPREVQDIEIPEEIRARSQYTIGASGSGKTSLVRSQIEQDLSAPRGLAVFDVEDALSATTLRSAVVAGRKDVVVFDPELQAQLGYALPLNLLKPLPGVHPYTAIEDILAAMRRAWPDAWGPRLEDIARHSLILLQSLGLTLAEMPRLLSDRDFRLACAKKCADERVRLFFTEHLSGIRANEYRTWIESTRNKVSAFLGNPFLSPMFAAEECIDLFQIMERGQVLVFNLSERVLKDSSRLLGMLLVSRLFQAALRRRIGSPLFAVYADEFQSIASRSFLDLVTRTRKRGIGVVLAHQNLTQPPFDRDESFTETLLGNCAVAVFFQMGRKDAERLAPECFPLTGTQPKVVKKKHPIWGGDDVKSFYSVHEEREHAASQLEHQLPRECFVRVKGNSGTEVWVAKTYEVEEPEATDDEARQLAEESIRTNGVPTSAILEAQNRRYARFAPEKASGGRKPITAQREEYTGDPL